MTWDEKFPIGNGTIVDEDDSVPIYRSYNIDCGITLDTEEKFNEHADLYNIFIETETLKELQFTPKTAPRQGLSNYYFLKLEFKIPRKD